MPSRLELWDVGLGLNVDSPPGSVEKPSGHKSTEVAAWNTLRRQITWLQELAFFREVENRPPVCLGHFQVLHFALTCN